MPEHDRRRADKEWVEQMGEPVPTKADLRSFTEAIASGAPTIPIPRSVLGRLGERVLQTKYGAPDGFTRTIEEVARELGYPRWRVSRAERTAVANLRRLREQH